ncbi:hypothetical protein [Tellurirhabdus bombi]|uniref:hypothetical protein n=1 Tax=Tellurirhabdus bombi TaxID=2907205 RepID=UPI001F484E98|nr:hypothetical protein [Tellurirhabdus bombi]
MHRFIKVLSLLLLLVYLPAEAQFVRLKQTVSTTPPGGYQDVYYVNSKLVGTTGIDALMPPNHKLLIARIRTSNPVQTGQNGFRFVDWDGGWRTSQMSIIRRDMLIRDTRHPNVPITEKTLTGNGTTGVLLPLFEKWYLEAEGNVSVFLKNAPPFTAAELEIQKNKIFGGTIPDGKATKADLENRGWKFTEARSRNERPLSNTREIFQIPNGWQFKYEMMNGADYLGPVIYDDHPSPTYEQGQQAASHFSNHNYPIWVDQISEGNPASTSVPNISPGYLGFVAKLKQLYPNRMVTPGYGENVQLVLPNEGRNYLHANYQHYWNGNPRKDPNGQDDPFFQLRWGITSFHQAGIDFLNQIYPDDPGDPDFFIRTALKLEIKLKQDATRYIIGFGWPWLETPGSARWDATEYDLKATNVTVRRIAGGIPDLIGQEWITLQHTLKGNGFLMWADHHNAIDDPNAINPSDDPSHSQIIPKPGTGGNFSYTNGPARPRFPYIGYDSYFHGYRKAVKILAHLGNDYPIWSHATYSMQGQTFSPPSNGMGLAASAFYCRPIVEVYSNPANGKQAVVAVDFFCDPWNIKTITVQLGNGKTIDVPLEGNAISAVLVGATANVPPATTPPVVTPPTSPTSSVSGYVLPDMALTYYLNNNNIAEHTSALGQFKAAATDNGAHAEVKVGAALSQFWPEWETSPGVWSSARAAQLTGIMDWAQSNGLKMGFRPVPLRNNHEKTGFYTDDQCQRTWDGNLSVGLNRSVPHYEYSVQALQPGGLSDQNNPAVKQYAFVKHLASLYKPYHANGTLTYALIGGGQNEEAQLAGDLGHYIEENGERIYFPMWGDFHEVVRQGYNNYYNLGGGAQLPSVNRDNTWYVLTQGQNRGFMNYRVQTLGHYLLLQAAAVYSEMPGLPIFLDIGQCMEGGGQYVGSWDTPELLKIVRNGLASRFPGVTIRVHLKKNPAPSYNMEWDGAFAAAHSLSANDPAAPSATEQDYYTASQAGSNGLVEGSENGYAMAQKAVAAWKGAGGQHITFLAQCQDQDGGAYPGAAWNLALETARQYGRIRGGETRASGAPTHTYTFDPNVYQNNSSEFKGNLYNWWISNGKPRFRYIKNDAGEWMALILLAALTSRRTRKNIRSRQPIRKTAGGLASRVSTKHTNPR